MEGKILFTYVAALLLSFVASMASAGYMIQVFRIDANLDEGTVGVRNSYLWWFTIYATVAPLGSAFATGFTFVVGFSLFTALAFLMMALQCCATIYMAANAIESPALRKPAPATQLRQVG